MKNLVFLPFIFFGFAPFAIAGGGDMSLRSLGRCHYIYSHLSKNQWPQTFIPHLKQAEAPYGHSLKALLYKYEPKKSQGLVNQGVSNSTLNEFQKKIMDAFPEDIKKALEKKIRQDRIQTYAYNFAEWSYSSNHLKTVYRTWKELKKWQSQMNIAAGSISNRFLKARYTMLSQHSYALKEALQVDDDALEKELLFLAKQSEELGTFGLYILGAFYHYSYQEDKAQAIWQQILDTDPGSWSKETSHYLLARYGGFPKLRERYFRDYPNGEYFDSLFGMNRMHAAKGDADMLRNLNSHLQILMEAPQLRPNLIKVGLEAFEYQTPLKGTKELAFLNAARAVYEFDWYPSDQMNETESDFSHLSLDPNMQKQLSFYPGLWEYYQALVSRHDPKRREALQQAWAAKPFQKDWPVYGELQVLKGVVYEEELQWSAAEKVWQELTEHAAHQKNKQLLYIGQLGLVRVMLNTQRALRVFASPYVDMPDSIEFLKEMINFHLSTEQLFAALKLKLKKPIEDLFVDKLSTVLLSQSRFSEYQHLQNIYKPGGKYTQIRTAVRSLLKNQSDPKGLLNIGYFLQTHHSIDLFKTECARGVATVVKPGKTNALPKGAQSPHDFYQQALASPEIEKDSELKAKILYHIFKCYRPYGPKEGCVWREEGLSRLKKQKYFALLKKDLASTKWAKKISVYN